MKAKFINKSTYRLVNETDFTIDTNEEYEVIAFYLDKEDGSMVVLRKFGYVPFSIEERELEIC